MNQAASGRLRWTRWAAGSLSLVVATAAVVTVSCTGGAPGTVAMTPEQKIARGHQLAYITGCVDCHTPGTLYGAADTTRMLSGSDLGWEGPWGVSYARNLTPDVETGIGSWSESDIETALRAGHRPDQTPILPPMPWQNFARMSEDDMSALVAYLRSLPPIQHQSPAVIPPGTPATGARLTFPPPPAWDAMNLPAPPPAATTP